MVIDLFGLTPMRFGRRFPEVYQHVLANVKPQREDQVAECRDVHDASPTGETGGYLASRGRSFARLLKACRTTSRRSRRPSIAIFQFLDASILPDNRLVCYWVRPTLFPWRSCRPGSMWFGRWQPVAHLEDRPIYTKSLLRPVPLPRLRPKHSKPASAPSPRNWTRCASSDKPNIPI